MTAAIISIIPIALLGGIIGLDVVSFPQAMVSRPIVAATLGGAFVGNGSAGVLIGVILELIALDTLPFGASKYPEWGSAAVTGGALFAAESGKSFGALPASVLAALLTASVSGWSMIVHRRLIARRMGSYRDRLEEGSRSALLSLHLGSMTMDLIRGTLVTFLALLVLTPLVHAIVSIWAPSPATSRAVVVAVGALVAAGALWKIFHSVRHALLLFLGGLAIGLLLVNR
ncbi:MAG: PTS sugar transporter subunit IIC [Gemmatimonadaceae bacterium]|nr:PTS sugar transporter subunit IIC [Gemmatimonadaceae bacterium]